MRLLAALAVSVAAIAIAAPSALAQATVPPPVPAVRDGDGAESRGQGLRELFAATEGAVVNALWCGRDVIGCDGRTVHALPRDDVLELLAAHHRVEC